MRAVIQRVTQATCEVEQKQAGQIQNGLVILLGIEDSDTLEDVRWMAQKFVNLRIFSDDKGLMNRSLQDIEGNILLVSQFTLFAQTKKGNRPSFIRAAKPAIARPLYTEMCAYLSQLLNRQVQSGIFGADMKIALINDGPVTIMMNSRDKDHY